MERGQTAWPGDTEPINFPLQPISHVLSLCPFLLMTHFLCPSAHFQAKTEKKKKGLGVRICLEGACLCVCVHQSRGREHTPGRFLGGTVSKAAGASFCQSFLSRRSASEERGGEGRADAPQVSLTQPPLSPACQRRWQHPKPCQCIMH